eukprot:sb/3465934/
MSFHTLHKSTLPPNLGAPLLSQSLAALPLLLPVVQERQSEPPQVQPSPTQQFSKVEFFEVVTPLGGERVFICASESCFGSHAFVSWPIWPNQSFTDSQNYALSGDIRFFAEKGEQVGAVTRKYDAARQKGGDNFKKSDFTPLWHTLQALQDAGSPSKMARHKKKTPGASNWEKLRKTIAKPTKHKTKSIKDPIQSLSPSSPSEEVTAEQTKQTDRKSRPLIFSNPTTLSTDITHRLAMDCEMVGVGKEGKESELAKVSIVNVYGDVVYNKYVIPRSHVTDYRAHITGLTGKILKEQGVRFKVAQAEVAEMIKDRIVIGHGLSNDFAVTRYLGHVTGYQPIRDQYFLFRLILVFIWLNNLSDGC